jgi:hypothetical protein
MEIKNSFVQLETASMASIPINLPYCGTLSVEANVVSGDSIDVFLLTPDQYDSLQSGHDFSQFGNFKAENTKNYKKIARVGQGSYYLILRDSTLRFLTAPSSQIKLLVTLNP